MTFLKITQNKYQQFASTEQAHFQCNPEQALRILPVIGLVSFLADVSHIHNTPKFKGDTHKRQVGSPFMHKGADLPMYTNEVSLESLLQDKVQVHVDCTY